MTDINRLRLFPAVFTVTPDAEAKLPSNWGEPCVQLVTAASVTLAALTFQVSFCVETPVHVCWCICQPCELLMPPLCFCDSTRGSGQACCHLLMTMLELISAWHTTPYTVFILRSIPEL